MGVKLEQLLRYNNMDQFFVLACEFGYRIYRYPVSEANFRISLLVVQYPHFLIPPLSFLATTTTTATTKRKGDSARLCWWPYSVEAVLLIQVQSISQFSESGRQQQPTNVFSTQKIKKIIKINKRQPSRVMSCVCMQMPIFHCDLSAANCAQQQHIIIYPSCSFEYLATGHHSVMVGIIRVMKFISVYLLN